MASVITLIPGDGIGPEVTEAVVRIFNVAGLDIEWERHDAGVTRVQALQPVAAGASCSTRSSATRSR